MEGIIVAIIAVVFVVVILPWLFRLKRGYMEKAITAYNQQHGTEIVIEKSGIPPIKFWLKNRKGDCWARVVFEDGTRKWARLRGGFFAGNQPLTFFD